MKKIGIGYEDYKRIIDDGCYYVDKTPLIEEIIEKGGIVTLFTRPRRFGKTLALSMLQTFFEEARDEDGNIVDNSRYFEGMKIMEADRSILDRMGKYPVIRLSLKSSKQPNFETSFMKLRDEISYEFSRHSYVKKNGILSDESISVFEEFEHGTSNWFEKEKGFTSETERKAELEREIGRYATALKTLSAILKMYHGQSAIILLDEYDVPLENAYSCGFYDEMVGFIRSLFESALKTNDALEFAVITGCLRIRKESIFTGLNNLKVNSVLSGDFSEGFGFNESETFKMLEDYSIPESKDEVKTWYDGYQFGNSEIYNPWSVINYVDGKVNGVQTLPKPYWSNTSSNSIIKDMVDNTDDSVKEELDILISGGTVEKQIHEDITYDDIYKNEDNLWNFLFFTGYLRLVSERLENDNIYATMRIPNTEIRSIYKNQIMEWFNATIKKESFDQLYRAITEKDTYCIENFLTDLLQKSISYFDSEESFYHGFFLSLLYGMPGYSVKSNREEGDGRPDITLYPNRPKDPAYIFELKSCKKFNEMDAGLKDALDQITDRKYEEGILDDGYIGSVSFGICFCKKSCIVGLLG